MSKQQELFIKKYKANKLFITLSRLLITIVLLTVWELLSSNNIINSFIFSSPLKVIKCIYNLYINHNLFNNIFITVYETLIAFVIGMLISILLSTILYLFKNIHKIVEPFLTLLNSMPKVALGPMIIIIFGANINSVIIMGVLINVIVSTIVILNGFFNISEIKVKLFKIYGANKYQLLRYLIIPDSFSTIISSFKLTISMSLIGVISGEFLVSKEGLGYLIIYGTQVFNMDLVITGIILLLIISFILYKVVLYIEKK